MKRALLLSVVAGTLALPALAQDNTAAAVGVLEEKVQKLRAEVEDLQVRLQKLEKDLAEQKAGAGVGAVSIEQLKTLEARIEAVDAARQKDKQAIIDQLAKELANLGGTKPTPVTGTEHEVRSGETLTSIAKQYGVTIAELRKANNLTGDALRIGQKLVVPKKL
jgi:LysM repeat protein